MPTPHETIAALDSQIEGVRSAAGKIASRVKEIQARVRERLASAAGTDSKAREWHNQAAELTADQTFEEARLAALQERRASIAAEVEAAAAKADRTAKQEAFKALLAKRDAAAVAAEKAATELGRAVRDMSAATTEIKLSAATVGLRPNIVEQDEIRYGVEENLYQAGCSWLFPEKPHVRYDAQGKLLSSIAERVRRSDADIASMLREEA